ncbi:MAG: hypothetical protein Q9184_007993, partial [Pyrenodesmia sp. 2 TL-2023]
MANLETAKYETIVWKRKANLPLPLTAPHVTKKQPTKIFITRISELEPGAEVVFVLMGVDGLTINIPGLKALVEHFNTSRSTLHSLQPDIRSE